MHESVKKKILLSVCYVVKKLFFSSMLALHLMMKYLSLTCTNGCRFIEIHICAISCTNTRVKLWKAPCLLDAF